jgi:hypothetical protein
MTQFSFEWILSLNYLCQNRGQVHGNIFYLQNILGHSALEMVKPYLPLQAEDLQITHQMPSPRWISR